MSEREQVMGEWVGENEWKCVSPCESECVCELTGKGRKEENENE